jgi:ATP-dependent Clp protease adaptor protein ClpS
VAPRRSSFRKATSGGPSSGTPVGETGTVKWFNVDNDFGFIVLKKIFHLPTLDALALTLVVHTKGKGIAGTYTFEVAEQKQCEVLLIAKIEEHPLRVEVEPA